MTLVRRPPSGAFVGQTPKSIPSMAVGPATSITVLDGASSPLPDPQVTVDDIRVGDRVLLTGVILDILLSGGVVDVSLLQSFQPRAGGAPVVTILTAVTLSASGESQAYGENLTFAEAGAATYLVQIGPTGGDATVNFSKALLEATLY